VLRGTAEILARAVKPQKRLTDVSAEIYCRGDGIACALFHNLAAATMCEKYWLQWRWAC